MPGKTQAALHVGQFLHLPTQRWEFLNDLSNAARFVASKSPMGVHLSKAAAAIHWFGLTAVLFGNAEAAAQNEAGMSVPSSVSMRGVATSPLLPVLSAASTVSSFQPNILISAGSVTATRHNAIRPTVPRTPAPPGENEIITRLGGSIFAAGASRPPMDLRHAHQEAARALVRVECDEIFGTGWVVALQTDSVVLVSRHVMNACATGDAVTITYYGGQSSRGYVAYISPHIDLAAIVPNETPPVRGLRWADREMIRGERVVIGGHPGPLRFITSEGVIAGAASGLDNPILNQACGLGNNCLVIDAESEGGSSGGPVVNREGQVVGMMWGTMRATSFSLCVHAHTLATELRMVRQLFEPHR